ncbi:uncharacterized protein LOC126108733 isoform X3 [Schistocerca cancellata]|uniref:uncharacterized protein LOC126108733 isoform X3 n=1 Tax=Schistocerca cancellata TaxID=274614 RepID=UPI0021191EED|nr:uncharacterized protein LOC126108733 isoform X3 [Schistocerca cancellata]
MYRIAAMDQKPPVWMKKEETDEVPSKSGSMDQVYPSSMNVKEELEVGANKEFPGDPLKNEEPSVGVKQDSELEHMDCSELNFVEDGSGISWSTDFIKEDPELNVEVDITDSIIDSMY